MRAAILDWTQSFRHEGSDEESDDEDEDDDESCVSSGWSDADEEEEEEDETAAVKALVSAVFQRKLATPLLQRLVGPIQRGDKQPAPLLYPPTSLPPQQQSAISSERDHHPPLKSVLKRTSSLDSSSGHVKKQRPGDINSTNLIGTPTAAIMKPDDFLQQLLTDHKLPKITPVRALELPSFFRPLDEAAIQAYTVTVMQAVRTEDVAALEHLHAQGHNLQCSNQYGESIVHTACRRGSYPVLVFLLETARLDCRLRCDFGRTPLHDACWTAHPRFDIVSLLLDACPDLLYLSDKRGLTPLAYTRAAHHVEWCRYLAQRGVDQLVPRELGIDEPSSRDGE